ncbi:hypothetical protein ACEWY4_018943 [Coilia grayii]|uniref:G-protein coupled receptors family 1 profile domain-containing protein n=1 Tax=Coilia grayii TaxID=363190 RepID=A0ABD1JHY7_9TELE
MLLYWFTAHVEFDSEDFLTPKDYDPTKGDYGSKTYINRERLLPRIAHNVKDESYYIIGNLKNGAAEFPKYVNQDYYNAYCSLEGDQWINKRDDANRNRDRIIFRLKLLSSGRLRITEVYITQTAVSGLRLNPNLTYEVTPQLLKEIKDIMQHHVAILCPSLKHNEEKAHNMFEDQNLAWFLTLVDYDISRRELCLSNVHCADYAGVGEDCLNHLHCSPGSTEDEVCDWTPVSLRVGTTADGKAAVSWGIPDTKVEEEGLTVALFKNDDSSSALVEKAVDGLTSGSFPTDISLNAGLQVRLVLKGEKQEETLWRGAELDDANRKRPVKIMSTDASMQLFTRDGLAYIRLYVKKSFTNWQNSFPSDWGALSRLSTLQWLLLGQNQIQSLDEQAFLGLRRLKELELSANQLRLLPNRTFRPLRNLRLLDLSSNQLSALSSSQFCGLRKLVVLRLRGNLLASVPVRVFQDLRKLQRLDLGENDLQTLARNAFVGLISLTELRLDQNRLNRINMGLFARLTSLHTLDLRQNRATWLGRTLHWYWPTLEHLDLSHNQLEWVEPAAFCGVPNLKSLLLESNRLQVLERRILESWVSLENLTLSGNPWDCGPSVCALAAWLGHFRGRQNNGPLCALPHKVEGENILDAVHAFQTCQSHVFDFNNGKNISAEVNTYIEMDTAVVTDTVVTATETEWYIVTETTENTLNEEHRNEEDEEEQFSAAEPFTVTLDIHPHKREEGVTIISRTTGLPHLLSNSSDELHDSCPHLALTAYSMTMASLLAMFISLATFGNTLVILSVLSNRRLQTATNLFICNLAVADLLLSVCVLPFSATLEVLGCWPFGRLFCDVWAALDVLCCSASILSLCAIAVDRYVGVRHSLHYRSLVTRRRATLVLACVWAVCVALSSPPLLGWKEPRTPDTSVCTVTQDPSYALFSSLLSFYLPLGVVLSVYAQVYVVARRTTRCLERGVKRERQPKGGGGGGGDGAAEVVLRIHRRGAVLGEEIAGGTRKLHARMLQRFAREKKAAKTLAMVVGVFVLCWLPFFIVLPLGKYMNVGQKGALFPMLKPTETVFKVVFWLGYSNSCINPFIYPCSNREFRRAFMKLLRVPPISRRSDSSSSSPPLRHSCNSRTQTHKRHTFELLCLRRLEVSSSTTAVGDCSERQHYGCRQTNKRTSYADCTHNATGGGDPDSVSKDNSSESSTN